MRAVCLELEAFKDLEGDPICCRERRALQRCGGVGLRREEISSEGGCWPIGSLFGKGEQLQ